MIELGAQTPKRVTVVIRARDEAEQLERLLEALVGQTCPSWQETEVIVVDNESRDDSVSVASRYGATVVTIPRRAFTFPKSINLGMAAATTPYVALTVAHAVPQGTEWLKPALEYLTADESIVGVYGPVIPLEKSTWAEKLVYLVTYYASSSCQPRAVAPRSRLGSTYVMTAINAVVRKSTWEYHHFDESYEMGGEDAAWARWAASQGYRLMCDRRMLIRHSHNLGAVGMMRYIWYACAYNGWPHKFDRRLMYREELREE